MPKDKFKFVWSYRENNGLWGEGVVREYDNTVELWEEVCYPVIKDFWSDDAVFWVVSAEDYPAYSAALVTGMKEAIMRFASEKNIRYRVVGMLPNGREIEQIGEVEEKGYYFIAYYLRSSPSKVCRSILEMLSYACEKEELGDCKVEKSVEIVLNIIEKAESEIKVAEKLVPIIEEPIDNWIKQVRSIKNLSETDSEIKLRGLLLVTEQCFEDIQNGTIALPKQIKAIGKLQDVAELKSSSTDKIIDKREYYEKEKETKYDTDDRTLNVVYKNSQDTYSKRSDEYDNERNIDEGR